MTQTKETAPTVMSPNQFEHKLNVYLKSVTPKRDDSKKEGVLNVEIKCGVVDGSDFDIILALIFKKKGSKEWLESAAPETKSILFQTQFKDHQAKFRVSSKTLANIPNVTVNGFRIDFIKMQMEFMVNAKGIPDGEFVGKLAEALSRSVHLEIARGKHWSANTDDQQLGLAEVTEEHKAKQKRIAKAKEVANKDNTNKARKRVTPDAEAKAKAKAKVEAKKKKPTLKAVPKKDTEPKK